MFRKLRKNTRGTAAIEFAMAASLLAFGVLNTVDLGYYIYCRMEVENAAQVGAQAAWKTCFDPSYMLPATNNCPGLNDAITAAVHSTTLGTKVSLADGYPVEGYYCVTTSKTLQKVGSLTSKPANCSEAGDATTTPADYIQVRVTFAYSPIFAGATIMATSGITSITKTSWMRLG